MELNQLTIHELQEKIKKRRRIGKTDDRICFFRELTPWKNAYIPTFV